MGDVWKVFANDRGCHATRTDHYGNLTTYCNASAHDVLTVPAGTKAAACNACIIAGAPHAGSAS